MKHLCGQTCLHKLVDEFMARSLAVRPQQGSAEDSVVQPLAADTNASLTSPAAYASPHHAPPEFDDFESSARLIPPTDPSLPRRPPLRPAPELVATPTRPPAPSSAEPPVPLDEPRFSSRNWRAEAWDRERERELRAVERRPDMSPRRRAGS